MRKEIVLFLIPCVLYVLLLPFMPLMEPDEARYSSISSAMNRTGDYVTPRLKGTVYLEKPPLCYWAEALSFKVFGENEFSARLFTGLCAWGCILLVYAMGRFFSDQRTGLYTAAVLSTALFPFFVGRLNILDMPLAFFVSLALWAGYRFFTGSDREKRWRWLYLFYFSSALAFLTKGLIGIVFPAAIVVMWLLACRRWRDIWQLFSVPGILIFLTVSVPWLLLVEAANRGFLWFFFVQEHVLRYATTMHGKVAPFYFYAIIIPAGMLPWCAFLVQAVRGVGKQEKGSVLLKAADMYFLLAWIGVVFIFFSFSSSKLVPYVAPLFPPIAVLLGQAFKNYDERKVSAMEKEKSSLNWLPIALQSLLFIGVLLVPIFLKDHGIPARLWWPWVAVPVLLLLLVIFLPDRIRFKWGHGWFASVYFISALFWASLVFPVSHFLTPYKSAYPLIQAIHTYLPANRELYQYKMSLYGVDFYTGMRTPVVDDFGELSTGIRKLSMEERNRYFLKAEAFYQLCRREVDIYAVTEHEKNVETMKKRVHELQVLWNNGHYYLVHVKSPVQDS